MSYKGTVIDKILDRLLDAGTAVFSTAEIGDIIDDLLYEVSERWVPNITLATVTTTECEAYLDISSLTNVIDIDDLEYPVDQTPRRWRNWRNLEAGKIEMDIDFEPGDADNVRVYVRSPHTIDASSTTLLAGEEQAFIRLAAAVAAEQRPMSYWNSHNSASHYAEMGSALLRCGTLIAQATVDLYQGTADIETSQNQASTAIDAMTALLQSATAHANQATAYIDTQANFGAPAVDWLNQANANISLALGYLNQARGYFGESSAASNWRQVASTDLSAANASIAEAKGYMAQLMAKISSMRVSDNYGVWGAIEREKAEKRFRKMMKPRYRRNYSREY